MVGVASILVAGGLLGAIGALSSAIIVSQRSLVASRHQILLQGELKIAEFRQSWINELRNTTANLMSIQIVRAAAPIEAVTLMREYYELSYKILLLMNREDPDFKNLKNTLREAHDNATIGNTNELHDKLELLMQDILRREWLVLKDQVRNAERFLEPSASLEATEPWWCYNPGQVRRLSLPRLQ